MTPNYQLAYEALKDKLIDFLFQTPPTIAELEDKEFLAYRAVSQGNNITRGCVR